MRSVSIARVLSLGLALATALAFSACESHHCFGPLCGCYPGAPCEQACGPGPCELDCEGFDGRCQSTCSDDCVVGCHDGPTCRTVCGSRCHVSCDHTSSCAATCGADCQLDCDSTSSCAPRVGDRSEVLCQSVGSCDVTCDGTCRVRCVSAGSCHVQCSGGLAKEQCDDGFACGRSC